MTKLVFSAIDYTGTEAFLKEATKVIFSNQIEFDHYIRNNTKLAGIKALKDYTGGGLKDCKNIFELYIDGKLSNIKEERKEKLERLAKKPLVDELILKLRNLEEDKLHSILLNLDLEVLLQIDEFLPDEIE